MAPVDEPDRPPQRQDVARARLDEWLDDALDDTFPASDPVATPPGSVTGDGERREPASPPRPAPAPHD